MYAVEVNVTPLHDPSERTVWRLLENRRAAEKLWYQLDALAGREKTVEDGGVSCHVVGARVWEVRVHDRAAAIAAVEAGNARVLKYTENVIFEISEEILEWIEEPLLRLPPDDAA